MFDEGDVLSGLQGLEVFYIFLAYVNVVMTAWVPRVNRSRDH